MSDERDPLVHDLVDLGDDAENPDEPDDSHGPDDSDGGLFPRPVTAAPHTGDPVIDAALAALEDSAHSGDLDRQIGAGERVHRDLQERLDDLGGA